MAEISMEGSPGPSPYKGQRYTHRHTQSLGLLSPVPSRDSLLDLTTPSSPSPLRSPTPLKRSATPSRVTTPVAVVSPVVHQPLPRPQPHTPSRSEQLLRDALRRGSMSAPRPASRQSQTSVVVATPEKRYYGGDAEFASSSSSLSSSTRSHHQHRPRTMSVTRAQFEGERDPAHEALRARLERMLALSSSPVSGSSSRRGSMSGSEKRASTQSAGQQQDSEAQLEWNALIRANTERSERERLWRNGVNVDLNEDEVVMPLPLAMTPRPTARPAQVGSPRTPASSEEREVVSPTRRRPSLQNYTGIATMSSPVRRHPSPLPQSPHSRSHSPHIQTRSQSPYRLHTPSNAAHSPYSPSPYSPTTHSPHLPTQRPKTPIRHNADEDRPISPSAISLARRHTSPAVPASPVRNTFAYGNVQAESPRTPSRAGSTMPGSPSMRARAQTEPVPASPGPIPTNPMSLLLEREANVDGERRQRRHVRKSSAYAALAALSVAATNGSVGGHAGYGGAHPAYPGLGVGRPQGNMKEPSTPGSTPPLTGDVDADADGDEEDDISEDERSQPRRLGRSQSQRQRRQRKILLTPPSTPPSEDSASMLSLRHSHDDLCAPQMATATFNARKASAQCRQLEGYVSFAAVEGLGEPPSPTRDDDADAAERRRSGKRGSLGAGIVGLWRGTFW
ncbi:hypothetical protein MIND_00098400 [Mycena indigotica]|uniref:Uncharacterized protein n=1 Tax=Mycena indigotica TaxID=2126181 RepID=A0A8H6TC44_9AGAR|nr:uncharacterized protein MIND_00098400 [Mycena indigotica]KAF7315823.1 hypothetical protein MIND_00098400 [Mycena indigotica]